MSMVVAAIEKVCYIIFSIICIWLKVLHFFLPINMVMICSKIFFLISQRKYTHWHSPLLKLFFVKPTCSLGIAFMSLLLKSSILNTEKINAPFETFNSFVCISARSRNCFASTWKSKDSVT